MWYAVQGLLLNDTKLTEVCVFHLSQFQEFWFEFFASCHS